MRAEKVNILIPFETNDIARFELVHNIWAKTLKIRVAKYMAPWSIYVTPLVSHKIYLGLKGLRMLRSKRIDTSYVWWLCLAVY